MNNKVLNLDSAKNKKKIVVHARYDSLAEIKKLIPSLSEENTIEKKEHDIYALHIERIFSEAPELLVCPTMKDLEKIEKRAKVDDFQGSPTFYEKAQSMQNFTIITDEFSNARGIALYKGIGHIENRWREFFVLNLSEELAKSAKPRCAGGRYDHKIACYTFSELFEHFLSKPLYEPPSEEFVLSHWNKSEKAEADLIEISKMTKLYEMGFPIKKEEFDYLKEIRNKTMHFRVITVQEYARAVEIINRYIVFQAKKYFTETMQNLLGESIRPILEAQEHWENAISEAIKALQPSVIMINEALSKYSYAYKSIFPDLPTEFKETQKKV